MYVLVINSSNFHDYTTFNYFTAWSELNSPEANTHNFITVTLQPASTLKKQAKITY